MRPSAMHVSSEAPRLAIDAPLFPRRNDPEMLDEIGCQCL